MAGSDRDLKIDAAAMRGGLPAAVGAGDRGLKMKKEVVASEGGDTLKTNEAMFNVVGLLAMKSRKDEAVASEAADDRDIKSKEPTIRPEEGGILRLKKEAKAAWDHWFLTRRKLRKAPQPQEDTQQAPSVGKKRKKVVKMKLPKEYVDHMAACPFTICADFSDEELARRTPEFREIYAAGRFLETKNREYWNALITQQKNFGHAEDENEVTDDDDDEEEEEVVKN